MSGRPSAGVHGGPPPPGRPALAETAHGFDATGNEHVTFAGLDRVRRHADRLQGGRAVSVDGGAWRLVEAGQYSDDPPQVVSALARGLGRAPDHVLHLGGVELGDLLEQRPEDRGAEVVGAAVDQGSLACAPDGSAGRGNDDGIHVILLQPIGADFPP
jgi:hypothetical protein